VPTLKLSVKVIRHIKPPSRLARVPWIWTVADGEDAILQADMGAIRNRRPSGAPVFWHAPENALQSLSWRQFSACRLPAPIPGDNMETANEDDRSSIMLGKSDTENVSPGRRCFASCHENAFAKSDPGVVFSFSAPALGWPAHPSPARGRVGWEEEIRLGGLTNPPGMADVDGGRLGMGGKVSCVCADQLLYVGKEVFLRQLKTPASQCSAGVSGHHAP